MKWEKFEMERWQSTYEFQVDYNLSESGVHPMQLKELVSEDMIDDFLNLRLNYIQTNGSEELRDRITQLYPGANTNNILVTNGSSEANLVTLLTVLRPGDEAVIMLPNYMQLWGAARGLGVELKSFHLREVEGKWKPDLDEFRRIVTTNTKMIFLCNPNNPTGCVLSGKELDDICSMADKVGAWVMADEVYRGAELGGGMSPGLWGRYDKALVTSGFSKAYGLPGLRIGWIAGPADIIKECWSYHDYTSICASLLSDKLATLALEPSTYKKITARTKKILRTNFPILKNWINDHPENLSLTDPEAGAIAFLKYNMNINSLDLAERLRKEKSVLIVPGDHFGMDGYIRIGYGPEKEYLETALSLIDELMSELK
jgi:aspartate/methionine/tyrosine aminotransferase